MNKQKLRNHLLGMRAVDLAILVNVYSGYRKLPENDKRQLLANFGLADLVRDLDSAEASITEEERFEVHAALSSPREPPIGYFLFSVRAKRREIDPIYEKAERLLYYTC